MEAGWPWASGVSAHLGLAAELGVGRGMGTLWGALAEGCCFHPSSLNHLYIDTRGISQGTGLTGWQQLLASSLYPACLSLAGFPSAPARCLVLDICISLVPSQGLTPLGLFWPSTKR